MKISPHEQSGFSRTELLGAIGVVALLAGLLWLGVHSTAEKRRREECHAHLRQIGVALQLYTK